MEAMNATDNQPKGKKMTTISIEKTILDGNLGDGWKDAHGAACAYAELLEELIVSEMADLAKEGHEIEVEISVRRNTCGYESGPSVIVDNDDYDTMQKAENAVQYVLDTAWEKFLESEIAASLMRP